MLPRPHGASSSRRKKPTGSSSRQIAAMTANLFQVMRIFEPSWEKRTEAICDIANMMNMAVAGTPEEQKDYVNASLYEAFNIPELCENQAGSAASPATPATSGRTWRAASCSSRATAWKRARHLPVGTLSAASYATWTTSMFTATLTWLRLRARRTRSHSTCVRRAAAATSTAVW